MENGELKIENGEMMPLINGKQEILINNLTREIAFSILHFQFSIVLHTAAKLL